MSYPSSRAGKHSGFSLVELIVALTIFALVGVGIANGVIQLKTTARALTFEQVVDETVNGYISQLKALDFNDPAEVIADGAGATVQIENNFTLLSLADPDLTREEASLALDTWVVHEVYGPESDSGGEFASRTFDISVRLSMENQNDATIAAADRRRYITARVEYTWEPPLRPERSSFREFIIGDGSNEL